MIEVKELTKVFRKPVRGEGLSGMAKTLFSRKYDEIRAVDGISFTVPDGEIVGYIGANGAGKSTTIKMMCGILTPSSGSVRIDGVEPYRKRRQVAQHIGVVFGQKTQLWWDIPLIESFKVLKEIYQISDADYAERMAFLGEVLDITRFLPQSVRTLSLGERMRADLAAAMLHNPRILFLDEPTIGLDVLVKEKIRQAIHALNKSYGTTVVLTTHDMTDIEDLCSRIILLEKLTIPVTVGAIAVLVVGAVFGAVIITSLKIALAALAFIFKRSGPLLQIIYNFSSYAKYPLAIYPAAIRGLLIFVVPFGLFISLPVDTLLRGTHDPWLLSLAIIGCAAVFFALAVWVWTLCERRYESTGS